MSCCAERRVWASLAANSGGWKGNRAQTLARCKWRPCNTPLNLSCFPPLLFRTQLTCVRTCVAEQGDEVALHLFTGQGGREGIAQEGRTSREDSCVNHTHNSEQQRTHLLWHGLLAKASKAGTFYGPQQCFWGAGGSGHQPRGMLTKGQDAILSAAAKLHGLLRSAKHSILIMVLLTLPSHLSLHSAVLEPAGPRPTAIERRRGCTCSAGIEPTVNVMAPERRPHTLRHCVAVAAAE